MPYAYATVDHSDVLLKIIRFSNRPVRHAEIVYGVNIFQAIPDVQFLRAITLPIYRCVTSDSLSLWGCCVILFLSASMLSGSFLTVPSFRSF